MSNASRGILPVDNTWTYRKQLEQLLQQVTTLRGDIASLRPMQTKGCLLRNNNIQRFALDTFPANCPGDMSLRSLVSLASLLLVVKVVFVVFPNSAGRIGNNSLSSLTVSDLLSVRYARRQQRDRRRGRGASAGRSRCGSRDSRRGCRRVRPRP